MRARPLPFFGVNKQFLGISGIVLGLPILLASLHVLAAPVAASLVGGLALALCAGLGVWAAIEGQGATPRTLAAIALTLAGAGVGGLTVWRALWPGPPLGRAQLARAGATAPLEGVPEADTYLLALRGALPEGDAARGAYALTLRAGSERHAVTGTLQRRKGPLGPGQVRPPAPPPREWARHEVRLAASPVTVTLDSREPALGEGVEVLVYPRAPQRWQGWALLGLLLPLALVAARFEQPLRRRFLLTSAVLTAGFCWLSASWTWPGDPLRPLLGAGAVALVPAWLVALLSDALTRRLPFAAAPPTAAARAAKPGATHREG